MSQKIERSTQARKKLAKGVSLLADTVTSTLGAAGRNVVYEKDGSILTTKDGVTVARSIQNVEDPIENMAINMVKQASIKTADKAGDGTTTATLLAKEIILKGMQLIDKGHNTVQLNREIQEAVDLIKNEIRDNISEKVRGEEQLKQVATISANNDESIGNIVYKAIDQVGVDGTVHIELSNTGETYLDVVEGIQFNQGYKTLHLVNNEENMTCAFQEPIIFITDQKITQAKDILPILEYSSAEGKALLIICSDMDGQALGMCVVNKQRGALKVCVVKAPDFGDRSKLALEDIAIATGGTVFSKEKGMDYKDFKPEWLGSARACNITRDNTTIIDGGGETEAIQKRIKEIKSQIELCNNDFEKEKLEERLGRLSGGISIVNVGGHTEAEMKERKDRVEDSFYATKAALRGGIVAGGGTTLIRARKVLDLKKDGHRIIYKVCEAPLRKILENGGWGDLADDYINKIDSSRNPWKGVNVLTGKIVDMKKEGIIDPAKVTTTALVHASSVATTVLLTECVIYSEDTEQENENYGMPF